MVIIGIDLGTTYSVAATFRPERDTKLTTIPLSGYSGTNVHTLRSAVYFDPESWAVEVGLEVLENPPSNVIIDVKRFTGMSLANPYVQRLVEHSTSGCRPFATDRGVHYTVNWAGKERTVVPEQVSAFILSHLKYKAEQKFESAVTGAVVTVPAYFTESQKGATMDAAKIAGLNVLRILTEPTAAAIHWILMDDGKEISLKAPLIVLDIGGGKTDISILNVQDRDGCKVFQVLGTAGDSFLGGQDINDSIYCQVAAWYNVRTGGLILDPVSEISKKLRKDIEAQKTNVLKEGKNAKFTVEGVKDPCTIEYKQFASNLESILKRTFDPLQILLDELSEKKITDPDAIPCDFHKDLPFVVLLTGGGSAWNIYKTRMKKLYPNSVPKTHCQPEVACAYGAAILAHKLSDADNALNIIVEDVTPMNIGIEIVEPGDVTGTSRRVATVVSKFTKFGSPAVEQEFETIKGKNRVAINIYEGDLPSPSENTLVDKFHISRIPTHPLPVCVKMTVNSNGVLEVEAKVISADESLRGGVVVTRKGCSDVDLSRMIKEHEMSKTNAQNLPT